MQKSVQDLVEQYRKTQIARAAKRLTETVKLTALEYCQREGLTDKSYTSHAQAVMLGGLQSQVSELLFWLKQAGMLDDNHNQ